MIKIIYLFLLILFIYSKKATKIIPGIYREMYISVQISAQSAITPEICNKLLIGVALRTEKNLALKVACDDRNIRTDVNVNDYTNFDVMFKNDYGISLGLYQTGVEKIDTRYQVIKVRPNHMKELKTSNNQYNLLAQIIYRCQGYTGHNCNKREIKNKKLRLDPFLLIPLCKDRHKCGDPICEDQSSCRNGICYKNTFDETQKYCVCNKGFYGKNCDKKLYQSQITEGLLVFLSKTQLPIPRKVIICDKCYGYRCDIYDDFTVCIENDSKNNIIKCDSPCVLDCGEYICRKKIYNQKSYFLKEMKDKTAK